MDLVAYLEPVSNLAPEGPRLLEGLRESIRIGFTKELVLKALRRYAFPVDELPNNWDS